MTPIETKQGKIMDEGNYLQLSVAICDVRTAAGPPDLIKA